MEPRIEGNLELPICSEFSEEPDERWGETPSSRSGGGLFCAKETNALGRYTDFLFCEREGKLVLAWLAGRSPYRWLGGSDFGIYVSVIDVNLPLGNSRVASKPPGRL